MKKDILCYLLMIISIVLFLYTTIYMQPIELIEDIEKKLDQNINPEPFDPIHEKGLENRNLVEEKYEGDIWIEDLWGDIKLRFVTDNKKLIEQYELYNDAEVSEEKTKYEENTYLKYGINSKEERDTLYNAFKNMGEILQIIVIDTSIENIEEGIKFDIKAIDENKKEQIFTTIIYNEFIDEKVYLKIMPKENINE